MKRIVVFEAHGDDMEFMAGGTIAKFADRGHEVTLVVATDNDKGSFELSAEGDGTRLRVWARMGPGRSGITPVIEKMPDKEERIIDRRLEEWTANMNATVTGIKELAEGMAE